jgi:diguanylate cyclase (GGDEF)-like protein
VEHRTNTTGASTHEAHAVLDWERGLLASRTLEQLIGALDAYPGKDERSDESPVATLVIADPTHELRHLLLGSVAQPLRGVAFVDSLVGLAPPLPALAEPWVGRYSASDHGLLFEIAGDFTQVALYPLHVRGALFGALGLAGRGAPVAVASEDAVLRRHVGAIVSAALERLIDRARLLRAGISDSVAGWHSRYYFQARLREEIARSQRAGTALTCAIVDVDRLGVVNDTYGQIAGDTALREIAERLQSQVRVSDATAHLGSDKFAVLMPETGVGKGILLAERVIGAVNADPVVLGSGASCLLTVSLGLAEAQATPGADRKAIADSLFSSANAAVHDAKLAGGNRYAIAGDEPASARSARHQQQK